jgi:hypothetical protein
VIEIIIALVIVGVALYLLNLVPMDDTIRTVIRVIVILFIILYMLQVLGFWHGLSNVRIR